MSDDITHSDLVTADGKRIRFASRIGGKSEAGLQAAEAINQQLRDQLTTKDRQIAELKRGVQMAIDHIAGNSDRFSVREGTPVLYQLRKILEEAE